MAFDASDEFRELPTEERTHSFSDHQNDFLSHEFLRFGIFSKSKFPPKLKDLSTGAAKFPSKK